MKENNYITVIESIKERIKESQHRAILSANKEMIILYWNVGKIIKDNSEWGNKFLTNLSKDIAMEFPNSKGFSVRNLKNMVRFYLEYPYIEFVQTVSAQIPWSHNIEILKLDDINKRKWYINETIENGWSLNVLIHQIDTELYEREKTSTKINNFENSLDEHQSELAMEIVKDPYIFDFIDLKGNLKEKDLEDALINNISLHYKNLILTE